MSKQSEYVRRTYSITAQRYDMILKAYKVLGVNLERWRSDAIAKLPSISSARLLDVGVGTGKNIPHLISRYPDYQEIVGIDYTPAMLVRGQKLVRDNEWEKVGLVLGDARRLSEYFTEPFDLIISTYSLSIIPNSPLVLKEIRKLMKSDTYLHLLDCQKFKGILRIYNPLAILLSTRLGGSNETYSVPVSDISSRMFKSIFRRTFYAGLFYEDLYNGSKVS